MAERDILSRGPNLGEGKGREAYTRRTQRTSRAEWVADKRDKDGFILKRALNATLKNLDSIFMQMKAKNFKLLLYK